MFQLTNSLALIKYNLQQKMGWLLDAMKIDQSGGYIPVAYWFSQTNNFPFFFLST